MANYILVHGGNMTTDTWNNLTRGSPVHTPDGRMGGRIWEPIVPALTKNNHHVLVPRLRDEHICDLTAHIGQVCALMAEQDLWNVILVGHSYGGMIITGVAARMTERIRRLVYIDAALPDPGQSLFDIIASSGFDPRSLAGLEAAPPYIEKLRFDPRTIQHLKKTYILCTKSEYASVRHVVDRKIADAGKEWTCIELPTSHVPMASMPDELVQLLLLAGSG